MTGDRFPALDALERQLAEAARDQQARRPWWRRIWRRPLVLVTVLAGFGVAGGATAARLISVGAPNTDPTAVPSAQRPQGRLTGRPLALTAPDPAAHGKWGVVIYTNRAGAPCALAGWVRGTALGLVEDGEFRPYSSLRSGLCGGEARTSISLTSVQVTEPRRRTLVYGRAAAGIDAVVVSEGAARHPATTGQGGAYLVVLQGRVPAVDLSVMPRRSPRE